MIQARRFPRNGSHIVLTVMPRVEEFKRIFAAAARFFAEERVHVAAVAVEERSGPVLDGCDGLIGESGEGGIEGVGAGVAAAKIVDCARLETETVGACGRSALSFRIPAGD